MGSRPKKHWGPSLWEYLHTITIIDFEYNESYHKNILNNLKNIHKIIPCHKCALHYEEHLKTIDEIDLTKPMVLFYWTVDLHNKINEKYNKPIYTYQQAIDTWYM